MSTVTSKAYDYIKSAILADEYKAGARIKEELVAKAVGISRTPIREALRQLASEGFVVMLPNQGVRVNNWNDRDLAEIVELRSVLEGFGAGLAAQKIGADELQELDNLCDQMDQAALAGNERDLEKMTELNSSFHLAIMKASGNRHLAEVIGKLAHPLLVKRRFSKFDDKRLQRSLLHHREVVDAFRAKDSNWATAVMKSHILASRADDNK
jgi:DNA-binding GntR family transcriptional regulator